MNKNICIVGVGPHAKRIYFKYFKDYNVCPKLIVELVSKEKETKEFLKSIGIEAELFLLEDKFKDDILLNDEFAKRLNEKCKELKISHAIISTEPKAHNAYLNFFIDLKIPVLSDKPITVRKDMLSKNSIKSIKTDFNQILEKSSENKVPVEIMCQRTFHKGYNFIKDLLKENIIKYNIPITFIEVYHSDGKWMMPHDLETENHPYKYGYGKLFHSGYHFIQLLSEIVSLNGFLNDENKQIQKVEMASTFISPDDELAEISMKDYKTIFKDQVVPTYYFENTPSFNTYGEKNNYTLLSFKNGDNKTITTAELNLLQNGFSRRGWIQTKADHYKGNGRVRHEYVNIQLGTLLNIQVHSYQSKEIKDRGQFETETGGLEHFDIYIFRNADLIGGKPYEKITLKDLNEVSDEKYLGQNEKAREYCITEFLNGNIKNNKLKQHKLGIELLYNLANAYSNYMASSRMQFSEFPYKIEVES